MTYVVAVSVAVLSMIIVLPQFSPALAALINCYTGALSAFFHLFEFIYLLFQIAIINPLYAAVYPDYGVFKNQVILITGASSGIGEVVTYQLCKGEDQKLSYLDDDLIIR